VRVLGHREADPAHDLQAVPVEAAGLRRIVRDQASLWTPRSVRICAPVP
jgi:hypothetical protein